MDPDGLSILILIISVLVAVFLIWCKGLIAADEENQPLSSCLGFNDRSAGIGAAFILVCGFVVYFTFSRFSGIGWWLIPGAILLLWIFVLFYAIGYISADSRSAPLNGIYQMVLGPVMTFPAKMIFKASGRQASNKVTEQEILSFVDDVEEQEIINESQKEMITNIFELDEVTAGDIMTHRTALTGAEASTPARDIIHIAREAGKSRIPVYRKSLDDIAGIIYVKDLLNLFDSAEKLQTPASELIHPVMFVPESTRARDLLVEFKRKHMQIAIVVDEYGGTAGVVTMEDVLEEIVGNIQDEFDNEEEDLIADENGYIVTGSLDIDDIFDEMDLVRPVENETYENDSISGLIIDKLGRFPAANEEISIEFGGILFTVLQAGERRVQKVRCTYANPVLEEQLINE